jgi:hypothetical protein
MTEKLFFLTYRKNEDIDFFYRQNNEYISTKTHKVLQVLPLQVHVNGERFNYG